MNSLQFSVLNVCGIGRWRLEGVHKLNKKKSKSIIYFLSLNINYIMLFVQI